MSASSKKVLLAVVLVFVLANAFFAAYYITLKKAPGADDLAQPAADPTAAWGGQAAENPGGMPPEITSVLPDGSTTVIYAGEPSAEGESGGDQPDVTGQPLPTDRTTAAAGDAATTVPAPSAAPAAEPENVSPTYIGGILVVNKSYPLPRSYDPGGLTDECESAFYEMQAAAEEEGLDLYISSGFRSYELQASLYQRYCDRDGQAAADTYSARPGHSEHQSGLAIDLNTITSDFAYTDEGKWVAEHCWEYGFILRYPADKVSITGYMYEPWHIRYLGKSTAAAVYQSGLCLEEYLGIDSIYND